MTAKRQVSWLVDHRIRSRLPIPLGTVASCDRAPHSQWRDRAGFTPVFPFHLYPFRIKDLFAYSLVGQQIAVPEF